MTSETQFPVEQSLSKYSEALTSLIKNKTLHRAVKSPGFEEFLAFLKSILTEGTDTDKLLALALACKVGNSVKTSKTRISDLLNRSDLREPPPLRLLSDSDDRYYAANVWRYTSESWVVSFLAFGILEEESAEKARGECADGLAVRSAAVEQIFEILEQHIGAIKFDTECPSDSMSRRLRRILTSVRVSLTESRTFSSENVGPALRTLLRKAFTATGPPKDWTAKVELAKEIFHLILQIARSRYALALLADTYSPIVTMRDWFSDAEWRDLSEEGMTKEFTESIQAAVELLARSGIVDNGLFGHLVLASGSVGTARELTAQIVGRNAGLSADIVAWLNGQPLKKSTVLSSESQMVRIEETIADLILSTSSTSRIAETVQKELVPQLALFDSLPDSLLSDLLSEYARLVISVQTLSDMRRLQPFGLSAEIDDFSALKHEFADPAGLGARSVRIIRPGIMVNLEDGSSRIVRKALVEPA